MVSYLRVISTHIRCQVLHAYRFYPCSVSYGRRVLPQHMRYGNPEPHAHLSSGLIALPWKKSAAIVLP